MDFTITNDYTEFSTHYDEESKIIDVPEIFENDYLGLGQAFFSNMRKYEDRVAQCITDTGEEDTYASLLRRCVRTALHLQTRQLDNDDVVCLCSSNHINSCVPFIACLFLGIKVASLDPTFNVTDASYLIDQVKPKIFFITPDSVELIEESMDVAGVTAEIVVFEVDSNNNPTFSVINFMLTTSFCITDTGEEDTYASLLRRCVRTALHLQTRQLDNDDVVCLCSSNHINSCVPFIACLFLGIKVASLDPTFNVTDASYLIDQVKPKIFFITSDSVQLIEESMDVAGVTAEIVVFEDDSNNNHTKFDDFLQKHEDEDTFESIEVDDLFQTAVIFFSSGTTGLPKGICLNHYGLLGQAMSMKYLGAVGVVNLSYASLYWISAVLFLIAVTLNGYIRVICSEFDAEKLWKIIDKYRVNNIFLGPFQASEMIKVGRPDGIDTTCLLTLLTGGGHFSVSQIGILRDLLPGTFLSQAYGQTEVSGLLSLFNIFDVKDRLHMHTTPESCGRPCPGMKYKVVDVETNELCGPNQQGELRVKTKYCMNGYYKMDSSSTFDSYGWLRTGDVVYFNDDLCLVVVDRIKEMLKYKSWHVAPAALEQVLIRHPAVRRAVVIGIPHELDGDHPMALVMLDADIDNVSEEDIIDFVDEKVHDRQKLRGGLKFVDSFVTTPSGKIKRKEMREMILRELMRNNNQ